MKYEEAREIFMKEFNEQTVNFLDYLYNVGFMRDMEELHAPMFETEFTHNKIKVAMMKQDEYIIFGIDPTKCFDKLTRSSIILKFPMSKREYHRALKIIFNIMDEKSDLHKRWIKEAPTSWYGAFYGRNFLT